MVITASRPSARSVRGPVSRALVLAAAVALAALVYAPVAQAGQASTGELFFYPCTDCHPVTMIGEKPSRPLPNDFDGHGIVLGGHAVLGQGDEACMACHDDPSRDPGKLKTVDGSLVDIKGDITLVCYRCHSAKYKEWRAGTHGKHKPSCTSAGCHDPHTPGFIYAPPLMPFNGSGFQFQVLPVRVPFVPFPPPAPEVPVAIPLWFAILATLGILAIVAQIALLVIGRLKR